MGELKYTVAFIIVKVLVVCLMYVIEMTQVKKREWVNA